MSEVVGEINDADSGLEFSAHLHRHDVNRPEDLPEVVDRSPEVEGILEGYRERALAQVEGNAGLEGRMAFLLEQLNEVSSVSDFASFLESYEAIVGSTMDPVLIDRIGDSFSRIIDLRGLDRFAVLPTPKLQRLCMKPGTAKGHLETIWRLIRVIDFSYLDDNDAIRRVAKKLDTGIGDSRKLPIKEIAANIASNLEDLPNRMVMAIRLPLELSGSFAANATENLPRLMVVEVVDSKTGGVLQSYCADSILTSAEANLTYTDLQLRSKRFTTKQNNWLRSAARSANTVIIDDAWPADSDLSTLVGKCRGLVFLNNPEGVSPTDLMAQVEAVDLSQMRELELCFDDNVNWMPLLNSDWLGAAENLQLLRLRNYDPEVHGEIENASLYRWTNSLFPEPLSPEESEESNEEEGTEDVPEAEEEASVPPAAGNAVSGGSGVPSSPSGRSVFRRLEEAGAVIEVDDVILNVEEVGDVILEPDVLELEESNEDSIDRTLTPTPTIDKVATICELLGVSGVNIADCRAFTGTVRPEMKRSESYYWIEVPIPGRSEYKVVAVSREADEAVYIIGGSPPRTMMYDSKSDIRNQTEYPWRRVFYFEGYDPEWLERVRQALFDDVYSTRASNPRSAPPTAPPGMSERLAQHQFVSDAVSSPGQMLSTLLDYVDAAAHPDVKTIHDLNTGNKVRDVEIEISHGYSITFRSFLNQCGVEMGLVSGVREAGSASEIILNAMRFFVTHARHAESHELVDYDERYLSDNVAIKKDLDKAVAAFNASAPASKRLKSTSEINVADRFNTVRFFNYRGRRLTWDKYVRRVAQVKFKQEIADEVARTGNSISTVSGGFKRKTLDFLMKEAGYKLKQKMDKEYFEDAANFRADLSSFMTALAVNNYDDLLDLVMRREKAECANGETTMLRTLVKRASKEALGKVIPVKALAEDYRNGLRSLLEHYELS